ncbi:MAG: hypothetical protein RLY31_1949 [Bacteroidota bacterium]
MQTLHQLQDLFGKYMGSQSFRSEPLTLYEPIGYILSLGGKRLRPAMVLAGHSLFSEDVRPSLPAAMAVEVFHNFTLVHDDIMDEAPLRRGKPTVHYRYGLNNGILSGDAMLILAYQYLMQEPHARQWDVLRIFNDTALAVCQGQQYDMDFEGRKDVTIPEYLGMIRRKTAVLLAAALQIGALRGGASDKDAAALYTFGEKIGMAFQLQDDVLDTFGDQVMVGKRAGGDIMQNKKTYLYLYALDRADAPTADRLRRYYDGTPYDETEKVSAVRQIFQDLGVEQAAGSLQMDYFQEGMEALSSVAGDAAQRQMLRQFAEALLARKG